MEEKRPTRETSLPGSKTATPEVQNSSVNPKKAKPFWIIVIVVALLISSAVAGYFLIYPQKEKNKVYHVGILNGFMLETSLVGSFKEKMTKLGYIEGKNIIYDTQETNADIGKDKEILSKFVADKVDLIAVSPTEPALMAKEATKNTNIPVVFFNTLLEGNNLVENVVRPGGNITGVRFPALEYNTKGLESFHEIAPQAKRLWVAYDPNNSNNGPILKSLGLSASSLGMTLTKVSVLSVAEVQADLEKRDKLSDVGMDVIMLNPDWMIVSPDGLAVINKFSVKHRIPVVSAKLDNITYGIIGYLPDSREAGELGAIIADKVFKGVPVGTIPVVTPEAYMTINYKAAQELGLTIPESLLSRATKIIR
jgi:putative tryptophan/tyrosine transport system substrate-binding protein